MEAEKIYPFILLLVMTGMIIGVGIITLDKFSQASYNTFTVSQNVTLNSLKEAKLQEGNLTQIHSIINATNLAYLRVNTSHPKVNYSHGSLHLEFNRTGDLYGGQLVYVTYSFRDYETSAKRGLVSANNSLIDIPDSWLGLIVTVFVLSIILSIVIVSFRNKR